MGRRGQARQETEERLGFIRVGSCTDPERQYRWADKGMAACVNRRVADKNLKKPNTSHAQRLLVRYPARLKRSIILEDFPQWSSSDIF